MSKTKKQVVKSALSVIQNIAPPIAAIATRLSVVTPEWAMVIALGSGLIAYWSDVAVDRGSELFEFIEQHKKEFNQSVITTEVFKATLLNVWEMHIRENSEDKRQRLRNFLLALGMGKTIPLDLHSKIYTVIGQMTDDEAFVFGHLYRNTDKSHHSNMHFNISGMVGLEKYVDYQLLDIINSLHSYRLVSMVEGTIGISIVIKQITPFGDLFYEYILKG